MKQWIMRVWWGWEFWYGPGAFPTIIVFLTPLTLRTATLATTMSDNHPRRRPPTRNNPWSFHLILPYLIVQVLFFLVWVFTQVFYVLSSTAFDEVHSNLLYGAPCLFLHPSRLTSLTGHASSLYRSERSSWDWAYTTYVYTAAPIRSSRCLSSECFP